MTPKEISAKMAEMKKKASDLKATAEKEKKENDHPAWREVQVKKQLADFEAKIKKLQTKKHQLLNDEKPLKEAFLKVNSDTLKGFVASYLSLAEHADAIYGARKIEDLAQTEKYIDSLRYKYQVLFKEIKSRINWLTNDFNEKQEELGGSTKFSLLESKKMIVEEGEAKLGAVEEFKKSFNSFADHVDKIGMAKAAMDLKSTLTYINELKSDYYAMEKDAKAKLNWLINKYNAKAQKLDTTAARLLESKILKEDASSEADSYHQYFSANATIHGCLKAIRSAKTDKELKATLAYVKKMKAAYDKMNTRARNNVSKIITAYNDKAEELDADTMVQMVESKAARHLASRLLKETSEFDNDDRFHLDNVVGMIDALKQEGITPNLPPKVLARIALLNSQDEDTPMSRADNNMIYKIIPVLDKQMAQMYADEPVTEASAYDKSFTTDLWADCFDEIYGIINNYTDGIDAAQKPADLKPVMGFLKALKGHQKSLDTAIKSFANLFSEKMKALGGNYIGNGMYESRVREDVEVEVKSDKEENLIDDLKALSGNLDESIKKLNPNGKLTEDEEVKIQAEDPDEFASMLQKLKDLESDDLKPEDSEPPELV